MSRKKNIIYVGGLDTNVTEEILHAAFIPFGDIKSIQIPKDYKENKNKGFGFVEFELDEDAADSLDNMDGAELYGKVLRCTIAKELPKVERGKAVWSAEEWIQNSLKEKDEQPDNDDLEILNLPPAAKVNE